LNAKTNIDFQKIQQIYEKLIEFSDGKLLGKSLFELSQLLLNQSYSFSASLTDPNHIFELLVQSAELGHPQAQVHIGAAYATGVDLTLVPMHASSSILLQYMAALSGRPEGHMAMGHRYLHGLGVPESCEAALPHYEYAANRAAEEVERRGFSLFIDHTRLSDTHRLNTRNRQDFDPEVKLVCM
jgi:TPR repeat protein